MSRPVEGWIAYYPDEVHDSHSAEWASLPDEGVQVIALYFDDYTADGALGIYEHRRCGDAPRRDARHYRRIKAVHRHSVAPWSL